MAVPVSNPIQSPFQLFLSIQSQMLMKTLQTLLLLEIKSIHNGHHKYSRQVYALSKLHTHLCFFGGCFFSFCIYVPRSGLPQRIVLNVPSHGSEESLDALFCMNCSKITGSTGNISEFDIALSELDEQTVSYIVFRHCLNVEIPARLQVFPNLIDFKIQLHTSSLGCGCCAHCKIPPKNRFLFYC